MHLHFMGIGGIGMSGLADLAVSRGFSVGGCDMKLNGLLHRLTDRGASITQGHDPRHLAHSIDLLVYSTAVSPSEPELADARARGIPTMTRGQFLAEFTRQQRLIAVAGAHGKTTTSGMAAQLLLQAGWDPTIVVGGKLLSLGSNAHFGRGTYAVAESDESDGSFLHLFPEVAIVTNLDREHLNHYQTFERLLAAFYQFVEQIAPGGTLIRCSDDPLVRRILTHPQQISYGFLPGADVTVSVSLLRGHGSRFHALWNGRSLGTFALQVPGRHNILNALGVVALGLTLDIPLGTIREALAYYQGAQRRFQVVRLPGDIWFVEDYAHHPEEIQATLAADAVTGRRRLVVFQPHRYSRTQSLEREFSGCFDRADGVIITDIYSAFERPIPGISGERLAGLIKAHGHPCVRYVPKLELPSFVNRIAHAGDTVFFLGAGDINEVCHELATSLSSSTRTAR